MAKYYSDHLIFASLYSVTVLLPSLKRYHTQLPWTHLSYCKLNLKVMCEGPLRQHNLSSNLHPKKCVSGLDLSSSRENFNSKCKWATCKSHGYQALRRSDRVKRTSNLWPKKLPSLLPKCILGTYSWNTVICTLSCHRGLDFVLLQGPVQVSQPTDKQVHSFPLLSSTHIFINSKHNIFSVIPDGQAMETLFNRDAAHTMHDFQMNKIYQNILTQKLYYHNLTFF